MDDLLLFAESCILTEKRFILKNFIEVKHYYIDNIYLSLGEINLYIIKIAVHPTSK